MADDFVKAPVTGTSIFGNFFELDFPLLKLPDVSLVKDSVISCNGDIAIELKAHAEAKEYTLPIANNIGATYDWIDDWNPEGPTTTDRVAQLNQTVEDNAEVTLKLLRSTIGDPGVDFYSIPVGTLVFETTADIPKLDEKIKFSETMNAMFGNLEFECCEDEDCDLKYGNDMYACVGKFCQINGPTVPPTRSPTTEAPTTEKPLSAPPSDSSSDISSWPTAVPSSSPTASTTIVISPTPTNKPSSSPTTHPITAAPPTHTPSSSPITESSNETSASPTEPSSSW
eukprot:CAMPEP_0198288898 /NCGR_PEP_ID=MMETSP1449-20131203/7268_1 /TAXON_ID=420275 /ORGANISM="Attheya septentrionalis, Strain CCMP2084" /LENGTH=283 /DNA_ID=CAMNT_0043987135 /DNA_START=134 /DNA_END=982 /DNA_ORIENTATION=-